MAAPFPRHTRSVALRSRADREQSYGSFGRRPIIFGSVELGGRGFLACGESTFPEFASSNPGAPASQYGLSTFRVTVRKKARKCGAFRASFSLWDSRIRTRIPFWRGKSLAFS
jgi:hypothetical protein